MVGLKFTEKTHWHLVYKYEIQAGTGTYSNVMFQESLEPVYKLRHHWVVASQVMHLRMLKELPGTLQKGTITINGKLVN